MSYIYMNNESDLWELLMGRFTLLAYRPGDGCRPVLGSYLRVWSAVSGGPLAIAQLAVMEPGEGGTIKLGFAVNTVHGECWQVPRDGDGTIEMPLVPVDMPGGGAEAFAAT